MPRPDQPLDVLYEDNHLLVINKPAGLATMGTGDERMTLVDLAKVYIRDKYDKPGNVYLGVVSRLDMVTSGVIVLARTSKSAARLTTAFRKREVAKRYLALIQGEIDPPSGTLEHHLSKDDANRRMVASRQESKASQLARLQYETLRTVGERTLARVELETGRKHQIRVQLASIGHAILDDKKYGSEHKFAKGIALHSSRLILRHPTRGDELEFSAPLPHYWPMWCRQVPV
jgi:23S rRNA pseudouridine1911/1915/1917 synthase